MSPQATISWVSIEHPRHTGGFKIQLPPATKTIEFLRPLALVSYEEEQTRLRTLIGCEECSMLEKFPPWAEETIMPRIGNRQEGIGPTLPVVEITCEGTDKMAKEQGICRTRFITPQTVEIELG